MNIKTRNNSIKSGLTPVQTPKVMQKQPNEGATWQLQSLENYELALTELTKLQAEYQNLLHLEPAYMKQCQDEWGACFAETKDRISQSEKCKKALDAEESINRAEYSQLVHDFSSNSLILSVLLKRSSNVHNITKLQRHLKFKLENIITQPAKYDAFRKSIMLTLEDSMAQDTAVSLFKQMQKCLEVHLAIKDNKGSCDTGILGVRMEWNEVNEKYSQQKESFNELKMRCKNKMSEIEGKIKKFERKAEGNAVQRLCKIEIGTDKASKSVDALISHVQKLSESRKTVSASKTALN